MDSLTLFGYLFKTPCEAICIFLDFFTEKRGSHREIYDFFRKSHETHCIRKRFSIYCNKNCSGNMRVLCPFAEITYTPSGDENREQAIPLLPDAEITHTPPGDENSVSVSISISSVTEITHTPPGDENTTTGGMLLIYTRNNLHPARGRKLPQKTSLAAVARNNLHPVRGRKPFAVQLTCSLSSLKQLTPR